MQFNRMRLTGFKSFVEPTELVIDDGLTGVVGPNGCGKSTMLGLALGHLTPTHGHVHVKAQARVSSGSEISHLAHELSATLLELTDSVILKLIVVA